MTFTIKPTEIPPLERKHLQTVEFRIVQHNLTGDNLYEHWEARFDDDLQHATFTFRGRTCVTEASENIYLCLKAATYIGLAFAEGPVVKVQCIPTEISSHNPAL